MTLSIDALVGGWQLVRWEISYGDGRPSTLPFGPEASGLLVYAPDGSMSKGGRSQLGAESARFAHADARLAAFDSFFSYGGRYRVLEEDGVPYVIHSVTQALNPGLAGTEQKRAMQFGADGTLTLSASDTVPVSGVARLHRLVWKRFARSDASSGQM